MDRISLKKIIKEQFPDNLQDPIFNWFDWDKNPETWEQVAKLVEAKNVSRLSEMFSQRQCFGTAGIRGLMEPGFNGMNDLVIIQTSQGLAKYLIQHKEQNNKNDEKIIVIGYDGRHHSMDFAKYTAKVFLESGFKVGLFSKLVPTPFVAFATKILKASAGIMITASHNPKQYNGYKVFWENGAQILSPHDENIQISILENLKPWNDELWNISNMSYESKLLFDPLSMIMDEYYKAISKSSANHLDFVKKSGLRITYTALHGVGHDYLTKVFQTLGFQNYFPVISQKDPDPEFPTVEFPNPEEGQGVFDEAINTANKNDCSLIFANDPDSDRFCMAELQNDKNGKTWRIFNGNEIGAFFGWWLWKQFDESCGFNKSDCYMISSAVSSKILQTLARKEKFNFIETLTGFKWMANHAYNLETKLNKKVLFCFEEAIGFMVGTTVFDKDGISATATILQLAAYLEKTKGQTFTELLTEIYQKYGFHYSLNSYYLIYDSIKIKKIFDRIPNIMGPNQYIQSVDNIKVTRIRDLIRGFDSSTADHKPTLPKSCMVTFYFENGSTITFRTSGTEPKIKYYSEIIAQPEERDWEKVKLSHQKLIEQVVQAILEPEKNGLIAKKN